MQESFIKIEQLGFGYSKESPVLNDMNMYIPKGSIYGLLGQNGAGKTTTLKLILSLIHGYEGNIFVDDKNIKSNYPNYLRKIGSLIETPSLYAHLSAANNLKIWCNYFNSDERRIPELATLLDLTGYMNRKTGKFSTGMKQRLAIAVLLLHDPELLILDEPMNGLDPMGLIDLRKILYRLNEAGKTILISSHILTELEKIVSYLGIIKGGKTVFEGTINTLQTRKENNVVFELKVNDVEKCRTLFQSEEIEFIDPKTIQIKTKQKKDIAKIIQALVKEEIEVYEVTPQKQDLEALFLTVSKENNR